MALIAPDPPRGNIYGSPLDIISAFVPVFIFFEMKVFILPMSDQLPPLDLASGN